MQMQKMTEKSIQRILKKTGHQLAVADWADIESLDRLAKKMSGVSETERRLLNSPFELGGLMFYPLTVAKSLWIKEKLELWNVPGELEDAYTFWLLTIPLGEDSLDKFEEKKKANRDMRRKSRKMNFTYEEITSICNRCLGTTKNEETGETERETQFGGMIACLVREYGQSPDYWLYECPVDKVVEMYEQVVKKAIMESEAQRANAGKNGTAQAPRVTPKLIAFRDYRNKEREIELKWSANHGE